jgi:hypothetical protein
VAERLDAVDNFESFIFTYPKPKDFKTEKSILDDFTRWRGINYVDTKDFEDDSVGVLEDTFYFRPWDDSYKQDGPQYVWVGKFAVDINNFVYYLMEEMHESEEKVYAELVFTPDNVLKAVRMPGNKFFRYINYETRVVSGKSNASEFTIYLNSDMHSQEQGEGATKVVGSDIGAVSTLDSISPAPFSQSRIFHPGNRMPPDSAVGKLFPRMAALYAQKMRGVVSSEAGKIQ